ncbi:MAG: hypothetical protein WCO73_08145 [Verrucomicrobiota bacterium]
MTPLVSLSPDAALALERLVVGRECNGFDRLPPSRKAHAYAELIKLGLVYGSVKEIPGQDYPEVSVQRVSSRGRHNKLKVRKAAKRAGPKGWKIATVIFVFVILILGFLSWIK